MHAMWMSVMENIKCSGKLTDVCLLRRKQVKCKCRSCKKKTDDEVSPIENPSFKSIFQPKYLRRWFYELENGDPSRNVIEKIFRAASTNPLKQHRKIKKVLRVNNTVDTLDKFEKYTETVKRRSFEHYKKHPRSIVDGNELLQFHVTTMNCCSGKKKDISELCKDPTCCVCRLLQSSFRTLCNSENGIQLSTSSDAPCEHTSWRRVPNRKNVKRAVIVCRTIAGRIINKDDISLDEEYDSVASGYHPRSQYLTVKDSSAILPCFIIVLN